MCRKCLYARPSALSAAKPSPPRFSPLTISRSMSEHEERLEKKSLAQACLSGLGPLSHMDISEEAAPAASAREGGDGKGRARMVEGGGSLATCSRPADPHALDRCVALLCVRSHFCLGLRFRRHDVRLLSQGTEKAPQADGLRWGIVQERACLLGPHADGHVRSCRGCTRGGDGVGGKQERRCCRIAFQPP